MKINQFKSGRLAPRVRASSLALVGLFCVLSTYGQAVPVRLSFKFILNAAGSRPANGNINTDAEIEMQVDRGNEIFSRFISELRLESLEIVDVSGIPFYYTTEPSVANRDSLRSAGAVLSERGGTSARVDARSRTVRRLLALRYAWQDYLAYIERKDRVASIAGVVCGSMASVGTMALMAAQPVAMVFLAATAVGSLGYTAGKMLGMGRAYNRHGLEIAEGDEVEIEIAGAEQARGALWVLGLPVVALFAGYGLGRAIFPASGEGPAVAAAGGLFALALAVGLLVQKGRQNDSLPVVTRKFGA